MHNDLDLDSVSRTELFEASRLIQRAAEGSWHMNRHARRAQRGKKRPSMTRALAEASRGRYKFGAPLEFETWGVADDGNPQRLVFPWEEFEPEETRDLTSGNFWAGGAMKMTSVTPLTLPLVGADVEDAGANVIVGVKTDQQNPAVLTKPPFIWQGSEATGLTNDTSLVLGVIPASPKRGGISLLISHQHNLQAETDEMDSLVRRLLIQMAREAISLGTLAGSGAAGQPTGILNSVGVVSVSGTNVNMPALAEAEANCIAADADDTRLTIFADPLTRRKLRAREISTGSGSVWPGRELLGHGTFTTSRMPANTILMGDFSNVDILLFGRGIEVLVNPFADFKSGRIEMEVSVSMDIVVHYPGSFTKITAIT